ncbi:TSUP family transporter [Marispirochaeta sp.]|uniref:TSUP family transporter n=1 Tax=Marispirochaeta sp. TaxID=2038653 RepID=UPI0029C6E10E|nr:TSUP family transporter [Marispirochaeta sp.]
MDHLTVFQVLLLVAGGFFAGFVDSIAGGGGIITLPLFLSAGIPPHMTLGTNKLQASFGSLTASLRYRHSGLISFRTLKTGIFFTFLGAALGTAAIQRIPADFLNMVLPVLLLGVFLYTLLSPRMGELDVEARMPVFSFYIIFGLATGFYDGFFGPGTGSFWTIALATLLGMNLKRATATTKVMNFTSNIVSLSVFILGGNVIFLLGILMGLGQLSGAWLGTHLVVKNGTRFVRTIFLIVVAATIANLLVRRFIQG